MDTREKILSLEQAERICESLRARGRRPKLIAGYFDVLTADGVRRLRALAGEGQPLLAAILDPPSPLLSARARAELAASLSAIDYVVPVPPGGLERAAARIRPAEILREEAADAARASALMEHVHSRQRA